MEYFDPCFCSSATSWLETIGIILVNKMYGFMLSEWFCWLVSQNSLNVKMWKWKVYNLLEFNLQIYFNNEQKQIGLIIYQNWIITSKALL